MKSRTASGRQLPTRFSVIRQDPTRAHASDPFRAARVYLEDRETRVVRSIDPRGPR